MKCMKRLVSCSSRDPFQQDYIYSQLGRSSDVDSKPNLLGGLKPGVDIFAE